MSKKEIMQARVVACYCAQIIGDTCNADMDLLHCRESLTVNDLVMAHVVQTSNEEVSGVMV